MYTDYVVAVIRKYYSSVIGFILGLIIISGLFSCGKVTQTTAPDEKIPSFSLTFTVPVVTTQNIKVTMPKIATPSVKNGLNFHSNLHTAIIGVSKQGGMTQLSWGKGIITKRKLTSLNSIKNSTKPLNSLPVWDYTSTAYDKRGIEMKNSDHTWAKPQFNQSTMTWSITATKIPKAYHRFLVTAYSDHSLYRLSWIDYDTVSSNVSSAATTIGGISDYDTFIALLEIVQMEEEKTFDHLSHQQLVTFIDLPIYNALKFKFPPNSSPSFDLKKPSFQFKRSPVVDIILTLFDFGRVDSKSAQSYLKTVDKKLLSDATKKLLKANLKLIQPQTGV